MGTRIVSFSVGLAALLAFAKVFAEEPTPPTGNLLTQARWLRFEVLGGRIVAASERCNQSQHEAEQTPAVGGRQKLHVAAAARGFTVHYLQEDVRSRVTLDLDAKGQLSIRRQLPDAAAAGNALYVQSASKVTLQTGGKPVRKFEADDLWQLLLTEPAACEEHLLPLLTELALCGQLARNADELEQALLAQAGADVHPLRQEWQDCMAKLASPNFAERQAADQTLRAGGQGVLAFLRELEPRQLSGEQRSRVQAMLRELPDGSPDSPPRVAQWLLADKRVWRALMSRGELPQRIAAAEHLGKLCRRPVAFDRDASTESHAAQLAELTRMLADN